MAGELQEKAWSKERIKARIEENELDLSLCSISKVPVNFIIPFNKVISLDLSCNRINTLPENFSKLAQLVQLDLSKNGITELPEDFGELTKLRKLDLFKNNLEALPLSFHKLKSLQWLDLKANPIQESLPRLVGDCLKPSECQQCAKNIVEHYSNLNSEKLMRERKAKKVESERIAKQKQEEEQVRQRRKEEKKRRLEEKKLENRNKKLEDTSDENIDNHVETLSSAADKPEAGRSCMRYFLYLILLLLLGGLVTVVVFNGNTDEMRAHMNLMVEKGRTYIDQIHKTYLV